jgi:hypothetical protein
MTRGKLRRRLRVRFIELNKILLIKAIEERKLVVGRGIKLTESEKLIASKLRNTIGYSCKTNDIDMVWSLCRLAKEIFKQ